MAPVVLLKNKTQELVNGTTGTLAEISAEDMMTDSDGILRLLSPPKGVVVDFGEGNGRVWFSASLYYDSLMR